MLFTRCRAQSLVVLAALLLSTVPLPAAEVTLDILHTNDIHQSLEPLPRIAGYVAEFRRAHPNTLFLDGGDALDRGSVLASTTLGETIWGAMARMGYDGAVLGNHDWCYGDARTVELFRTYPVPVLGTNLATTAPPLPPSVHRTLIKEFQGIRVGLFGITLDDYGKDPRGRPNLYVLDAREATAAAIAELKAARVDLIVAVTHLGIEKMKHETKEQHPTDPELAREFPDIDVIVGGHTHTLLDEKVTRQLFEETGAVVVQSGAMGQYVSRLNLVVDDVDRRLKRYSVEHVRVTPELPVAREVASFLEEQYARHLPGAKTLVGEFTERIEFHNLAYWLADFLRQPTGADVVLLPRRTLYDEPASFGKGPVTLEYLFGLIRNRYLFASTVSGAELRRFCAAPAMADRFHPLHHGRAAFSGDAFYASGIDAAYDAAAGSVSFDLDDAKEYRLVTPWPFLPGDIYRYQHRLPAREVAEKSDPVPGLKVRDAALLPETTWSLLEAAGKKGGLHFTRRYPQPRPDWAPWQERFEAALKEPAKP